ncbi:hypothetical protein ACIP9E_28460, partial [Micromonospora chalcea]
RGTSSVLPRTTSSPTAIRPWSRSSMKAGVAQVVVLWMTVKVPSLVRRFSGQQGRSIGIGGVVLRTVALQGMTRNLGRLRAAPVRRTPLASSNPIRPPYRHMPGVYPSPE